MTELFLERTSSSSNGTFGILTLQDDDNAIQQVAYTCEPPPHGLGTYECMPAGRYWCIRHNSPKHPNSWEITNVPGHTAVLIHIGNTIADTKMCVLVGLELGKLNGVPAILHSTDAMAKLDRLLPETGFWITVS